MYKNIKVEAEHNELILENSNGDKVIIPANKRNWVKQKLSEGCHGCIDSLVETLPVASQYAQDGSIYPDGTKVKVNQNNQIKEYDISSPEYKDLYNSGKLMSYDKTSDTYTATPLEEVTVTAEAPQWVKYKKEYEKTNPKSNYINQYLTPFAKSLGNTETNYPKRLDDEYEQKSLNYVSEQIVKNKPQNKFNRAEWLNQMTDKEEELIKRNPKYQSSYWEDTKRGLTSLMERQPYETVSNILSNSDFTNREKQEMLKDYAEHPIMSKFGDALKVLSPLNVIPKVAQSAYRDDTTLKSALKGEKNNAGIVEDILTDVTTYTGLGLAKQLGKVNKVVDATKVGSKVLNKTDDIFKSEINWGKWNKEIPENKALMQEYNAIEQQAKADGTWMKNPDGSAFKGTPEQFIQQNSENFKKAFSNVIKDKDGNVQINYHGQREGKPFNKFKPSQRGKLGVGNYTATDKDEALRYAKSLKNPNAEERLYELYINSNNPQQAVTDNSIFKLEPSEYIKKTRLQPGNDYLKYFSEQVTSPENYLKSAIGNNGMFDMTNPNIYKSLIPLLGYNLINEAENNKNKSEQ